MRASWKQSFLRQAAGGFLGNIQYSHLRVRRLDSLYDLQPISCRQHRLNDQQIDWTGVPLECVFRIRCGSGFENGMTVIPEDLCEDSSKRVMIVDEKDCTHQVLHQSGGCVRSPLGGRPSSSSFAIRKFNTSFGEM